MGGLLECLMFSEIIQYKFPDDWRCDQYRWVNQGVQRLPKSDPEIKKSYFQSHTVDGSSSAFTRHAYRLIGDNNVVLVHYMGDEKAAIDFPHGNGNRATAGSEIMFVLVLPR